MNYYFYCRLQTITSLYHSYSTHSLSMTCVCLLSLADLLKPGLLFWDCHSQFILNVQLWSVFRVDGSNSRKASLTQVGCCKRQHYAHSSLTNEIFSSSVCLQFNNINNTFDLYSTLEKQRNRKVLHKAIRRKKIKIIIFPRPPCSTSATH